MALFLRDNLDESTQYSINSAVARRGDPLLQHPLGRELNLPHGLFALRNRGTRRVLDVRAASSEPGAQLCLYTAKALVLNDAGGLLDKRNNQLFYLDVDGHLVSAAANLQVTVFNGAPHLTSLQPVQPFSHAESAQGYPPRFRLDPETSTLHLLPSSSSPSTDVVTILEAIPSRAKADTSPWSAVTGFLSGKQSGAIQQAKEAARAASGDDVDEDDSPEALRLLRVVALLPSWREDMPRSTSAQSVEARRWRRRQWDVLPVAQPLFDEDASFEQADEREADAREVMGVP